MFNRSCLVSLFALAMLAGCSGATNASTSVGATSEALRGVVTRADTSAHRLSLQTARGEIEATWKEPEVRHGAIANLTVGKEIELRGHSAEKEFEVETIELEPELADDKDGGAEPGDDKGAHADGGDDKGLHADGGDDKGADGGRGADDDAAAPGVPPVDDHGGKGKP